MQSGSGLYGNPQEVGERVARHQRAPLRHVGHGAQVVRVAVLLTAGKGVGVLGKSVHSGRRVRLRNERCGGE